MVTDNPLFRLLAVNLARGVMAATIAVAGLVGLDCFGLSRRLLHDRDPAVALVLLTFGSR
jgi:hypothetical protein